MSQNSLARTLTFADRDMLCMSPRETTGHEMPGHSTQELGQPTTAGSSISAGQLLSLPDEILLMILSFLHPSELKPLDKVCWKINNLVVAACKIRCRTRIPQLPQDASQRWRAMAFNMEKFLVEIKMQNYTPHHVVDKLLHDCYLCSDADLAAEAQECLIALHQQATRELQWYKAIATACMAKKWYEDAAEAYDTFLHLGGKLGEDTWLTAARFGWPHHLPPLPRRSTLQIKERSMLGAAAAGDLGLMRELHAEGVGYDLVHGDCSLSTVAARYGNKSILLHLHQQGIDVVGLEHENSPIREAAVHNLVDVASFLLETGADPHPQTGHETPVIDTLRYGSLDVLRMFIHNMPALAATNSDGELLMRNVLESSYNKTTRREIIKCLAGHRSKYQY